MDVTISLRLDDDKEFKKQISDMVILAIDPKMLKSAVNTVIKDAIDYVIEDEYSLAEDLRKPINAFLKNKMKEALIQK